MDRKVLKMSDDIVHAIDEELAYQSSLEGQGRVDEQDHGVAGQLVTLEHYTRKATATWVDNAGETEALDSLRKVAAIAIRALELYGCPRRVVATSQRKDTACANCKHPLEVHKAREGFWYGSNSSCMWFTKFLVPCDCEQYQILEGHGRDFHERRGH